MDSLDIAILALRTRWPSILCSPSRDVGLSTTPCWMRVQQLEKSGAIGGYGAQIDARSIGLDVFAFVEVMIAFAGRAEFEAAVMNNVAVLECYTTANEADYMLKIVCRDVDDLDDLLRFTISLLQGLQRSSTMICLKAVKRGAALTSATRPHLMRNRS